MTDSSEEFTIRGDEAVEKLLEHAAPRPAPPSEHQRVIREAVHAEWQAVTGRIRTRRRVAYFAVAATVVLGAVATFNALQVSTAPAIQVATIDKSHGSIYLLGEQSELHEIPDLTSVNAGQVIVTGDGAGIGLTWSSGGSLRVDQNTQIEFTSRESIYLRSGRVYFDSEPSILIAGSGVAPVTGSAFGIETDHGSVRHVGTQYMTATDTKALTVSVREGQVAVDGAYVEEAIAIAGQQLTVSGGARPRILDIDGYGDAWSWIEATMPRPIVDGRTVHEFLTWVGRETGRQVSYTSAAAEQLARNGVLKGNVDMGPKEELAFRMAGEDLTYRIDRGTIFVSEIKSDSRP